MEGKHNPLEWKGSDRNYAGMMLAAAYQPNEGADMVSKGIAGISDIFGSIAQEKDAQLRREGDLQLFNSSLESMGGMGDDPATRLIQSQIQNGSMTSAQGIKHLEGIQAGQDNQTRKQWYSDPEYDFSGKDLGLADNDRDKKWVAGRLSSKYLDDFVFPERGKTFQDREKNLTAFTQSEDYQNAPEAVKAAMLTQYGETQNIDPSKLGTPEEAAVSQLSYGDKFFDYGQKRVKAGRATTRFNQGQETWQSKSPDRSAVRFQNLLKSTSNIDPQEMTQRFDNGEFGDLSQEDFQTSMFRYGSQGMITSAQKVMAPTLETLVPVMKELNVFLKDGDIAGANAVMSKVDVPGQVNEARQKIQAAVYQNPMYSKVSVAEKDKVIKQMEDASGITATVKRLEATNKRYDQVEKKVNTARTKSIEAARKTRKKDKEVYTERNPAFSGASDDISSLVHQMQRQYPAFTGNTDLLYKVLAAGGQTKGIPGFKSFNYRGRVGEDIMPALLDDVQQFVLAHPDMYPDLFTAYHQRKEVK